ncbi:MAG: hypothetical protein ACHQDY_08045 [Solirubrobacterales bacterium]
MTAVGSLIFILAPTLGAIGLATVFVIALGIVAARADDHFDRQLVEEGAGAGALSATSLPGGGGAAELERYAPPPEVATAVAVAATTSNAVIAISSRSPAASLGKLGRRSPIPSETSSAQHTSRPPAM